MSLLRALLSSFGPPTDKPLGWLREPVRQEDWKLERLLGSLTNHLPLQVSLRPWSTDVLDQGTLSTCVPCVLMDAERIAVNRLFGLKLGLGSRLFNYYPSRRKHDKFVTDTGTMFWTALSAANKYGIIPESEYPYTERLVNRKPPASLFVEAYPSRRRLRGFARVRGEGEDRKLQWKNALAAGRPVCTGLRIGREFMRNEGPLFVGFPQLDPMVGGHAVLVTGYKEMSSTTGFDTQWEVKSSWSKNWRDGGYVWAHEAFCYSSSVSYVADPGNP